MDDQELDYEELDQQDMELESGGVPEKEESVYETPYKADIEDAKIDRQERIATEKAFGIKPTTGQHLKISSRECVALRTELGAEYGRYELRAAFVHGVDGMNEYNVLKVFQAFRATNVFKIDNDTVIVQFMLRQDVAAMMLNMTKVLKRVRGKKVANEEGEVNSDDEEEVEEGQIMEERGDDVEVVEGLLANAKGIVSNKETDNFVTVDIGVRPVPSGRWRVVTKHVPKDHFMIVRYPTTKEYESVKDQHSDAEVFAKKRPVPSSDFWSHETSHRGGLNMFDKDGNELDWDYEHDTRFYDESKEEQTGDEKVGDKHELEEPKKEDKFELPKNIKVRGRGSVRCGFLFGNNEPSSLASDDQREIKKKKKMSSDDSEDLYKKDDVLSRVKVRSIEERLSYT